MKSNSALIREEKIMTTLLYTLVLAMFAIIMFVLGYAMGEDHGIKKGKRSKEELDYLKSMWRES
jgi:hypothetical protein